MRLSGRCIRSKSAPANGIGGFGEGPYNGGVR